MNLSMEELQELLTVKKTLVSTKKSLGIINNNQTNLIKDNELEEIIIKAHKTIRLC